MARQLASDTDRFLGGLLLVLRTSDRPFRLAGKLGDDPLALFFGEVFDQCFVGRFQGRRLVDLLQDAFLHPVLAVEFTDLVQNQGSQMIIATHSPLVLAYPESIIYSLDSAEGPSRVAYERTEHFALTRDFLSDRGRFLRRLFEDEPKE